MMENKRFCYDWKTGGFKDTQSNSCATTDIRIFETQINNVCLNYEKKIKKLERENEELKKENEQLKQDIENLKTTLVARETLIDVCEKKFKELGYIITVDDDGYVIE